ncbi:Protein of unknown function DUF504 [Methanosalsum zhilinae DSM 4017]|uniref:MJ1316 RNA cyclic group end recognition domain-containing protein n=1 Tax=Methanosalsum zhilinae (strain DSM 4017 / NBRC 107636 / OCM 62 / WeN5) TaxID=679901 RepID=F7XKN7_METZD|nr:RNA repair domain-containing protein [Methanosalsum zhilinae]AEH60646.1 Protein of unknown function DUF504 [Methanosalsum zhilinae DSM 4017]
MEDEIKSGYPRNILNEIKWKNLDFDECIVEYIHRGMPEDKKVISGVDIKDIGRSFITLYSDTMIPYHRILRIKYKGNILYLKKRA